MDNRSDSDSEYFTADEMSDNESCEFILSTSPNGTPWIIPNPCFFNSHKVTVQTHFTSVWTRNPHVVVTFVHDRRW